MEIFLFDHVRIFEIGTENEKLIYERNLFSVKYYEISHRCFSFRCKTIISSLPLLERNTSNFSFFFFRWLLEYGVFVATVDTIFPAFTLIR